MPNPIHCVATEIQNQPKLGNEVRAEVDFRSVERVSPSNAALEAEFLNRACTA